jgi:hypothetical protein
MSHTDRDDAVGADPSPSRAEALGTGGAEPPPKQIRPMAGPTLIAAPGKASGSCSSSFPPWRCWSG